MARTRCPGLRFRLIAVLGFFLAPSEGLQAPGQPLEFPVDQEVNGSVLERPVFQGPAGLDARQDFDPVIDGLDRVDVEFPRLDGLDHVGPEHQVLDILMRDDDALGPRQSLGAANLVESLDLLVDAADGLDLALLVQGPGDGDVLADAKVRKNDSFRVLRQGMGYALSVFVAKSPVEGFTLLRKTAAVRDADLAWIVRENLKKKRLSDSFAKDVQQVALILEEANTR